MFQNISHGLKMSAYISDKRTCGYSLKKKAFLITFIRQNCQSPSTKSTKRATAGASAQKWCSQHAASRLHWNRTTSIGHVKALGASLTAGPAYHTVYVSNIRCWPGAVLLVQVSKNSCVDWRVSGLQNRNQQVERLAKLDSAVFINWK